MWKALFLVWIWHQGLRKMSLIYREYVWGGDYKKRYCLGLCGLIAQIPCFLPINLLRVHRAWNPPVCAQSFEPFVHRA